MGERDGRLPDRVGLARHLELIELATQAARGDERIAAAWVSGSLASDFADQFSDIDVHIAVREEDFGAFAEAGWADFVSGLAPTVLTRSFQSGRGGFAVTSDWMHFDVVVHRAGDQLFKGGAGIRPLFDRTGGLLPKASATGSVRRGEPYFPGKVVEWFFYMLGNLAVVVGRDEPVLGTNGAVMLRDTCLVPLMHAEEGVVRTGGNKRLRAFLTEEQHLLLEELPAVDATLESVIASYAATSNLFVTRGRALAHKTDGAWPGKLEEATRHHLRRSIGRPIPAP